MRELGPARERADTHSPKSADPIPGKRTLTEGLIQYQAAPGQSDAPAAQVQQTAAAGVSGAGGPLPHRATIQSLFGRHDVSGITAHTDASARDASGALGAEAYATGRNVAFASASPSLHTAAHEAAHVIQQASGVQLKAGVGQVGDAYERHADAVADHVVQGKSAEPLLDAFAGAGAARGGAVQFVKKGFAVYGTNGQPSPGEAEHYKNAEQRKSYVLKVEGGNVSYATVTEGDEERNNWSGAARVQYVFTPGGTFYGQYYGPGVEEGSHDFHTRYTAGANVTCGGWMDVSGHALTKIGNDSGHYKPEKEGMYKMLTVLGLPDLPIVYVTPENTRESHTAAEFLATHKEGYDTAEAENQKLKKFQISSLSFDKFGSSKGGGTSGDKDKKPGGKYDNLF
jgi:hypothetical protein